MTTGREPVFTVEEAEAFLGVLSGRLERIREARRTLIDSAERIRDRVVADGGGHGGGGYWDALAELREELEALSGRGIILRDPETGLVDFPAERGGKPIFLCWRLGEERVAFWHDTETGFTGRKPL